MGVIEVILAVIGLVLLVMLAIGSLSERSPASPVEADRAAPYREGLYAAIRMQAVAQDLEQQMFAEALRLSAEAELSTDIASNRS